MKKYLVLYYFILLVIQLFLTNMESPPPTFLRLAFMVAVIGPVIYQKLLPSIIILFYTTSVYHFAYAYMPYDLYWYLLFCIVGFLLATSNNHIGVPIALPIMAILTFFVNMLTSGVIENITFTLLIITFFCTLTSKYESSHQTLLPVSFLICSVALSILFLMNLSTFAVEYSSSGLERSGWTDPNYFAMVLGAGFISGLLLISKKTNSYFLLVSMIIALIVTFVSIILLASRGAILAIILALIVFLLQVKMKRSSKIIFVVISCVILLISFRSNLLELFLYRIENDSVGGGSGRVDIWTHKLGLFFSESSILQLFFGHGLKGGYDIGGGHVGVHSDYIAILLDYGIIGAIVFLVILFAPILSVFKNPNHKSHVWVIMVYLFCCLLTLEPLATGNLVFWGLYYYAWTLSRMLQK